MAPSKIVSKPPDAKVPGNSEPQHGCVPRGGYPTVIVALDEAGHHSRLADRLQREGYNVLEALDWTTVFHFIKVHSRPIHLLLAHASMSDRVPILREHRQELQFLSVTEPVDADAISAQVRQLLGSPPR